jgi:large subunit ribosomal protein L21
LIARLEVRMYAVIQTGGKQYKVSAGDKLKVEKLGQEDGAEVALKALLVVDGDQVWTAGAKGGFEVKGKVLCEGKRRKVLVFHKKRRKQYKKLRGHRQPFTEVEILDIVKV